MPHPQTPTIEQRPAQPYAAIRLQVGIPFGDVLVPAWDKVHAWLAAQGLSHGPSIIRYLTTDMSQKLDIEVGLVLEQDPPAGSDDVITGMLPAGKYATLLHTGPYDDDGVYQANVTMVGWAKANQVAWKTSQINGVEWWGSRIEWYLSDPDVETDPTKYRTELAFLLAEE